MNSASSGMAIGPPWQSTMMSFRTAQRRFGDRVDLADALRRALFAEVAPIAPPVVTPICATMMSAPAFVIASASSGLNT